MEFFRHVEIKASQKTWKPGHLTLADCVMRKDRAKCLGTQITGGIKGNQKMLPEHRMTKEVLLYNRERENKRVKEAKILNPLMVSAFTKAVNCDHNLVKIV